MNTILVLIARVCARLSVRAHARVLVCRFGGAICRWFDNDYRLIAAILICLLLSICAHAGGWYVGSAGAYPAVRTQRQDVSARVGYAAHYGIGKMERAARVHGVPWQPCMVASSYYPLHTVVDVYSRVTGRWARCVVADVSRAQDVARIRARGIVIELGAANIGLCNLRRVGQEPPRKCPVEVYRVR